MIKNIFLAVLTILISGLPALADETEGRNKDWNVDVKLIEKLSKEKKCKEVIMYREVLPFFGKENTAKASKEITVQFEKEDLASGRAIILHEKTNCDELLGTFFVMCTTDTALCYFEEKENAGKGKKLSKELAKKKTKTARRKKVMKAKKTKTQ
jgi:hypothetical protein